MTKDKPDTPAAATAPPVAPLKVLSLEERLNKQEIALLEMQKQLQMQLNGVANQLFLIQQLKHPEEALEGDEAGDTPPEEGPPGTI